MELSEKQKAELVIQVYHAADCLSAAEAGRIVNRVVVPFLASLPASEPPARLEAEAVKARTFNPFAPVSKTNRPAPSPMWPEVGEVVNGEYAKRHMEACAGVEYRNVAEDLDAVFTYVGVEGRVQLVQGPGVQVDERYVHGRMLPNNRFYPTMYESQPAAFSLTFERVK